MDVAGPEECKDVRPATPQAQAIGICLSGGGVRATFFALGVLMFLVESRLNERVRIISSVSGGSIASLLVALSGDFASVSTVDFVGRAKRAADYLASHGVFFLLPRTVLARSLVSMFFGFAIAAVASFFLREEPLPSSLWEGFTLGFVVQAILALIVVTLLGLFVLLRERQHAQREQYCALIAAAFNKEANFPQPSRFGHVIHYVRVNLSALLLFAGAHHFFFKAPGQAISSTAKIATWAQSRWLMNSGNLCKIVICSTDLASGSPFYATPTGVFSPTYGRQPQARLALLDAVYASAAFPGAFSPFRVRSDRLGLRQHLYGTKMPRTISLTDGGVYNNLGSEALELASAELTEAIIINAGVQMQCVEMSRVPVWRNFRELMRINSVMYNSTVKSRLVSLGLSASSRPAVVLDLSTSSRELCFNLREASTDPLVRARATQLMDSLPPGLSDHPLPVEAASGRGGVPFLGRRLRAGPDPGASPSSVPTTLWPVGPTTAERLMRRGFSHAAITSRIMFGVDENVDPAKFVQRISDYDFSLASPDSRS